MTIIWSSTNGGPSLTSTQDLGGISNGDSSTDTEYFVRHSYSNPITNAGVYLRQFSGTYSGDHTALIDFNEIIGWGNASVAADFGGVLFNFDASGSYPSSAWSTVSDKSPANGDVCRTGFGDSELNAITLPGATGCLGAGQIPNGAAPNVRFKIRTTVPSSEDTLGVRQAELMLRFTYTS